MCFRIISMVRVLFSARQFDRMAGGLERQAISILNALVHRGYDYHLMTRDMLNAETFHPLDEGVCWHRMGFSTTNRERLARLRSAWRLLTDVQPDIVLGFQQGPYLLPRITSYGLLGATTKKQIRVVACERVSPFQYKFVNQGLTKHKIYATYQLADAITVQCPSYVDAYPRTLRHKVKVIPNAVKDATGLSEPTKPNKHALQPWTMLHVGRHCDQKSQSLLLQAFANLSKQFPDWHLVFVGDGNDLAKNQKISQSLDLQDRVSFEGAKTNVTDYYRKAHVFVFPSKYEGFPNALAEALAHGLPSVGFAGCAGVSDLISHNINGLAATGNQSLEPFQEAMAKVMSDTQMRGRMHRAAIESMKTYEPNTVFDQWDEFLQEVVR